MPELRRRPARAAGSARKLYSFGKGSPRVETADSRLPKAMSADFRALPVPRQGSAGAPLRLMSPTDARRSGRTVTGTGLVVPARQRAGADLDPAGTLEHAATEAEVAVRVGGGLGEDMPGAAGGARLEQESAAVGGVRAREGEPAARGDHAVAGLGTQPAAAKAGEAAGADRGGEADDDADRGGEGEQDGGALARGAGGSGLRGRRPRQRRRSGGRGRGGGRLVDRFLDRRLRLLLADRSAGGRRRLQRAGRGCGGERGRRGGRRASWPRRRGGASR